MKLTNQTIYQYAEALASLNDNEIYIPAKANFLIQKNISTFAAAAQEIDKARLEIAKHYGEATEDGQGYTIPNDKIPLAAKELEDLFAIEQDISIRTFKIEDLGDTQFTSAQMSAIMFMIED